MILNRNKVNFAGSLPEAISEKFNKLNYKRVEPGNNEDIENVEFWIEGNSRKVKECHIIVKDNKNNEFSCLASFYGNFNIEDLGTLGKFGRSQAAK